jgi:hypothetical protein
MRGRLALALLASAVLTTALVAGGAGAATKVRTKITIGTSGSTLKGKVKSRKGVCRKGRRVVVYRGSSAIARTKSHRRGKWHVNLGANRRPGRYHAVAKKKKHRSVVCKRARSRTITIGGGGTAFSTKLTIRFTPAGPYTGGTFSGTVGSPAAACISGRTVRVYSQGNGTPIGSDTSSGSGSWQVQAPPSLPSGDYYAATPAESIGGRTCHAGQSPTVAAP